MRVNARAAWTAAHRRQRIERRQGAELYRLACECVGVEPDPDNAFRDPFTCHRIFSALEKLDRPAFDRYDRTRTVLNNFGRLNPWRWAGINSPAKYRDSERVRVLRTRLLERRLIAPEPGGYVTGLLSVAPPRKWWDDYPPEKLAPFSARDLACYGAAA